MRWVKGYRLKHSTGSTHSQFLNASYSLALIFNTKYLEVLMYEYFDSFLDLNQYKSVTDRERKLNKLIYELILSSNRNKKQFRIR